MGPNLILAAIGEILLASLSAKVSTRCLCYYYYFPFFLFFVLDFLVLIVVNGVVAYAVVTDGL